MLISILFVALGIALVSGGAHYLVEGASSLAKRLGVSDLIIGMTVVAFGTSAPELVVSVIAALNGSGEVAIGNVIGSNTANIGLILGLTAIIQPLRIRHNTIWKDIPFSFVGIIVVMLMAGDHHLDRSLNSQAVISRSDGLVLLCFFAIYLYYTYNIARQERLFITEDLAHRPLWLSLIWVVGGLVALAYGGRLTVDGAIGVARALGVSEAVIGLTIVAVGTSLPELATSVAAALRGRADMAMGNVVGSNIFNTFFILGVSATVRPLAIGKITLVDFIVCMLATILMFAGGLVLKKQIMYRPKGWLLFGLYLAYVLWLVLEAVGQV
ncbi:MAG: calcium/sodium antiporter [Saprospiraceae bacterium]|nr:calcium/sodium antiporter [Saprospiraceae bacterium]MDW8229409.1 calcium/sodium antiporter [Saprospiraceae bacterium]